MSTIAKFATQVMNILRSIYFFLILVTISLEPYFAYASEDDEEAITPTTETYVLAFDGESTALEADGEEILEEVAKADASTIKIISYGFSNDLLRVTARRIALKRAIQVRNLLKELGVPYECITIDIVDSPEENYNEIVIEIYHEDIS